MNARCAPQALHSLTAVDRAFQWPKPNQEGRISGKHGFHGDSVGRLLDKSLSLQAAQIVHETTVLVCWFHLRDYVDLAEGAIEWPPPIGILFEPMGDYRSQGLKITNADEDDCMAASRYGIATDPIAGIGAIAEGRVARSKTRKPTFVHTVPYRFGCRIWVRDNGRHSTGAVRRVYRGRGRSRRQNHSRASARLGQIAQGRGKRGDLSRDRARAGRGCITSAPRDRRMTCGRQCCARSPRAPASALASLRAKQARRALPPSRLSATAA